jgi:hypothetical protein
MCYLCHADDVVSSLCCKLSDMGFRGVDVSAEVSLVEYGLLCKVVYGGEDGPFFSCIVGVSACEDSSSYNRFDTFSISVADVESFFTDNLWASIVDVSRWSGWPVSEWLKLPAFYRLDDLLRYYGYENVFGISYNPVNLVRLVKLLK